MAARLIQLGWVQKIDQANIPNLPKNLIAGPLHDAGVRPGPQVLAALAVRAHRHRYNTKTTGGQKIETHRASC